MAFIIGNTKKGALRDPYFFAAVCCPLGTTICGAALFCKNLGVAWFVAPAATQLGNVSWNGSNGGPVGDKPCVSDWASLSTALTNAGLTPSQWFVPSQTQLQSGYACRTYWDSFCPTRYWSSTESSQGSWTYAPVLRFNDGFLYNRNKATNNNCVRAMRCVTY
jgi:hypothetical protein